MTEGSSVFWKVCVLCLGGGCLWRTHQLWGRSLQLWMTTQLLPSLCGCNPDSIEQPEVRRGLVTMHQVLYGPVLVNLPLGAHWTPQIGTTHFFTHTHNNYSRLNYIFLTQKDLSKLHWASIGQIWDCSEFRPPWINIMHSHGADTYDTAKIPDTAQHPWHLEMIHQGAMAPWLRDTGLHHTLNIWQLISPLP